MARGRVAGSSMRRVEPLGNHVRTYRRRRSDEAAQTVEQPDPTTVIFKL
jgi:hypothetical protein